MISTKSERKLLKSTIWLTVQITRKFKNSSFQNFPPPRGGGDSHIKGAEMLVENIELNPKKENNLGVAQPFLAP